MATPSVNITQRSHLLLKLQYLFHDMERSLVDESDNPDKMDIEMNSSQPDDVYKAKMDELEKLFKKIKLTFDILGNLLKYMISNVGDEKYKKVQDDKVEFPKTIDLLICIVGCYSKAFTQEVEIALFELIDSPCFTDLYNISEIHTQMIPFVIDDNINLVDLKRDYNNLANEVRNLASDILGVNTDFEETFIETDNIPDNIPDNTPGNIDSNNEPHDIDSTNLGLSATLAELMNLKMTPNMA